MLWISEELKHWRIGIVTTLTIGALIADKIIRWYITQYKPSSISPEFWVLPLRILLLLVWGAIVWSILFSVYYQDKTGRKYRDDRRASSLGIIELLRFYSSADPYRMDFRKLPIKRWQEANGIILGKAGAHLLYRDTSINRGEGCNTLIVGLPGSGKTSGIIIPSCLRFGGSVLAIDIKGDILAVVKKYRKKIKVFAPFDPERSYHYDPLRPLRKMDDIGRELFISQMAEILITDDGSKDGKYFVETARDFFCGITLYLYEKNTEVSLPEISKAIVLGNATEWIDTIHDSDVVSAKRYVNNIRGSSVINYSGGYNEASKRLRLFSQKPFSDLLVDNGNCITPESLDDGYDCYLEIPQNAISLLSPLMSLIVKSFMDTFMRRPDLSEDESMRPILFMLDEYGSLSKMDISEILATGRSRKLSLCVAIQSVGQLIKRYGDYGMREITDTMRYITILSAQDPTSRKWCQELIGKRRVLKRTYSESEGAGRYGFRTSTGSGNRAEAEAEEYIFKEEDFANLGNDLIIYADGKYIKAEKCFWFK